MTNDTFEQRRQNDPQSVIDDLIGQTSRQAKAINEHKKQIEQLNVEINSLKKGK
jgi:hypothetical protein